MPAADPVPSLPDRIRAEIRRAGPMRFDRFMALALYDPSAGYYRRADRAVGPGGDFYTAADVHPIFGRTVAAWVEAERAGSGEGGPFVLAEVGPGEGTLARQIREAFAPSAAPMDRHVLVEAPGPRRDRALAMAGTARPGPAPEGASSLAELGPFRGVVLANELLDAFPTRRFLRRDGAWRELRVDVAPDGTFRWAEGADAAPPDGPTASDGTVLERSDASEAWLREAADHLVDGAMLLIDYGAEEGELLRGRPSGTLAVARRHRADADPLGSPGDRDLSMFVNFTRIRDAARRAGWRVRADRPMAEALGAWGFARVRDEALSGAASDEARVRVQLAAKNLLFGFGNFRALELEPA